MNELIFLFQAESDIQSAYNSLETFQPDRGELFLRKLDIAFSLLRMHPYLGPKVSESLRRILVPGFPFGVFYQVQSSRLVVVGVKDLRKSPSSIRNELGLE